MTTTTPADTKRSQAAAGVIYGVAAYAWWGFVAVYFKLVSQVPPLEILAHRVVWSVVVLLLLIAGMRLWRSMLRVITQSSSLLWLSLSTILIAINWYTFIWAVTNDQIVQASLGYFINPLVNVVLGFVILRERLRRWETVSVTLAGVAVLWLTISSGVVPWVSLILAFSFGLYGLVRKLAGVGSIEGLTVETLLLLPIAGAYLAYRDSAGALSFGAQGLTLDLLLVAAGPVTALPLLWFASAVRRLRLATVGLLQYIAPTLQFVLAIAVYNEPFGGRRMIAFLLIWAAVAIYSADNYRHRTRKPR